MKLAWPSSRAHVRACSTSTAHRPLPPGRPRFTTCGGFGNVAPFTRPEKQPMAHLPAARHAQPRGPGPLRDGDDARRAAARAQHPRRVHRRGGGPPRSRRDHAGDDRRTRRGRRAASPTANCSAWCGARRTCSRRWPARAPASPTCCRAWSRPMRRCGAPRPRATRCRSTSCSSPRHIARLLEASGARILVALGPHPVLDIWQKALALRDQIPGLTLLRVAPPGTPEERA